MLPMDGGVLMFTKKQIVKIVIPLFLEQLLTVLVGMVDTMMVSSVGEAAVSDYHRALLTFLNYDALKQQLASGRTPRITYKKINGETVTLSVYRLDDGADTVSETLWIFSKTPKKTTDKGLYH